MNKINNLLDDQHEAPSVAILIIVHQAEPTPYELISLRQCTQVLGRYPIVVICPEGMDVTRYRSVSPDLEFDFIAPKWQANYRSFNRLKIAPLLYKKYRAFEHILFYELDAFVFEDALPKWCATEYSYIGAPWYHDFDEANKTSSFIGVGNGGLSLRKTSSALKALSSFKYITPPRIVYRRWRWQWRDPGAWMKAFLQMTFQNNTHWWCNNYVENEDYFWGRIVENRFSWFTIPIEEVALKFSIETMPRLQLKRMGGTLPFGCHGWWKYDLDFWKPFIESYGHKL